MSVVVDVNKLEPKLGLDLRNNLVAPLKAHICFLQPRVRPVQRRGFSAIVVRIKCLRPTRPKGAGRRKTGAARQERSRTVRA